MVCQQISARLQVLWLHTCADMRPQVSVVLQMLIHDSMKLRREVHTAVVEVGIESHTPAARRAQQHERRGGRVLRPKVAVEDERAVRICNQPGNEPSHGLDDTDESRCKCIGHAQLRGRWQQALYSLNFHQGHGLPEAVKQVQSHV